MAQTTIELRNLLQTDFELFDFDYGCIDAEWQKQIEKSIIDYYYFSEIGQETADRFKHRFRTKLQRIMPYYNKLYETTKLEFDPFLTEKMEETYQGILDTQGTNRDSETMTDYPQTQNPADDIPSGKRDNQGSLDQKTDNTYTRHRKGYTGLNYPQRLKEYRQSILRITSMLVGEMATCFILVY